MNHALPTTTTIRPGLIYGLCCLLAFVAKLYCAATTFGTNDTGLFQLFGQAVYEAGLQATYENSRHFNHTPLLASVLAGMFWLSQTFGWSFPFLLRLPGIVADLVSCVFIWRLANRLWPATVSRLWCCLFALSPVAFMVSGYHGNFDSVLAMFLCIAAYCCVTGQADRSAVCLAMAIHVKVAALVLSPVFFFFWLARGKGARFFAIVSALVLAVWLLPLLGYPRAFVGNVLGYGSYWGVWGINYWLRETGYGPFHLVSFYGLAAIQTRIMLLQKIIVVAGVTWIAWRRRKESDVLVTISYAWAIFFAFAPGVLLHYLAWPSGLLLIHSRRWFAAILGASSVFLFWCYTVINGGLPWDKGLFRVEVLERWIAWSNVPWIAFLAFGATALWHSRSATTGRATA